MALLNALTRQLLEGAGEEEFTRWVKKCARHYGWNGVHLRYSEAVLESLHSLRVDGWSEALGQPDWQFWHEQLGESFFAELKGARGSLSKDQKRTIPSLRKGGNRVFVWYPRDAAAVEFVFRHGLSGDRNHVPAT